MEFILKLWWKFTFIILCLLLHSSSLQFAEGSDARSRLYTKILLDYQAVEPPFRDDAPLIVDVALSLQHVGQVNEAEGSVKVTFGLYQNWTDETTAWSQDEFNITSVLVPNHAVWRPDTVVHKGVLTRRTESKNVNLLINGQVVNVDVMDVSLPCIKSRSDAREESNKLREEPQGQKIRVCTLTLGAAINSHLSVVYNAKPLDVTGLQIVDEWQLSTVRPYQDIQTRPVLHDQIAVAVFDFILVKNETVSDVPMQLVAPSIVTSLAALGVFVLPPMAGERILMVGVAFLGQLLLMGFSVLAGIQSTEPDNLFRFMLFSTVYIFLIIVSVLSSFFIYPFLKRFKNVESNPEEDGAQLLIISDKRFVSSIPDAFMFIFFVIFYVIGMGIIFF